MALNIKSRKKKDMVYNTMEFPCEEFGEGIKRQVRLAVSPQTTGEQRISLVFTIIPPGAVSEGHIHSDCDEYIFFESAGRAILDGVEFEVPAKAVVHAKTGVKHECINISQQKNLNLFCVFTPPFEPYGLYNSLIPKTKSYLGDAGVG